MKKIFIILSRDPRSAQSMMFLINSLLDKNYYIYLFYNESELYLNAYEKLVFESKNIKIYPLKINQSNKVNYLKKIFQIAKEFKNIKPTHVITVDKKSFLITPILAWISKKFKNIHIVLDFDDPKNESYKERVVTKLQFFFAKYVDLFLFPSTERAKKFFEFSKSENEKFIVLSNHFPKHFKPKIGNDLDQILKKNKVIYSKIVCTLGTIGHNHYFKELIESVVNWDKGIILIIGGWPNKGVKETLDKIIIKNNLEKKVLLLSSITEKLWAEILFKSHLGICFYKQDSISHKFMAGPSTKLSNYLLANIPFLACDNHDFRNFNSKFNICELVDASDPKKIAKKVNDLFYNNEKYNLLKKNSKIAFLENLNFDTQFNKVYLELINLEKNS